MSIVSGDDTFRYRTPLEAASKLKITESVTFDQTAKEGYRAGKREVLCDGVDQFRTHTGV